jgi:hypothetical protein
LDEACPAGAAPAEIPEIVQHMRGHRFNVDGRHGIHYQIGTDRYCVMIFTSSDFKWLDGARPQRQRGCALCGIPCASKIWIMN